MVEQDPLQLEEEKPEIEAESLKEKTEKKGNEAPSTENNEEEESGKELIDDEPAQSSTEEYDEVAPEKEKEKHKAEKADESEDQLYDNDNTED